MTTDVTGPGDGSDYLDHLARESARFLDAVLAASPAARVPTCPDWDADDLLWHLAGVQWFWAEIVRTRAADPGFYTEPERPADRAGLETFFRTASEALGQNLAEVGPRSRVWTWASEQSAGFVRRRQAHEALVHRVDAELTAGSRTPLDPALAADGVDEALGVMFGGVPPWGTFVPDAEGAAVRVRAADPGRAGRSWLAVLGRWTGTSPTSGKTYDEACLDVRDDDGREAATLTGRAADLDCTMWNRPPPGEVVRAGDERSLAIFDAILADGIQ